MEYLQRAPFVLMELPLQQYHQVGFDANVLLNDSLLKIIAHWFGPTWVPKSLKSKNACNHLRYSDIWNKSQSSGSLTEDVDTFCSIPLQAPFLHICYAVVTATYSFWKKQSFLVLDTNTLLHTLYEVIKNVLPISVVAYIVLEYSIGMNAFSQTKKMNDTETNPWIIPPACVRHQDLCKHIFNNPIDFYFKYHKGLEQKCALERTRTKKEDFIKRMMRCWIDTEGHFYLDWIAEYCNVQNQYKRF